MGNYSKIQYELFGEKISKEEADNNEYYEIAYYNEAEKRVKVELFENKQLSQLVYPDKEPPFEEIIREHLECYPNMKMEIETPKVFLDDGGYKYTSYIYLLHKNFELVKECYFDKDDNLLREVELDENNKPIVISTYVYDESGELIEVIEESPQGNTVGGLDFGNPQKF
ncbi:hypothetical protein [Acetivibrio cellulolyticus]|uniref:hypothetical protein n=1 Tax=Acetivibrio cellulolyticus TaxID=35830 RepID=UPI0001E3012A|nr:hypothetical protein [Acetivibrio cellulolyticus]